MRVDEQVDPCGRGHSSGNFGHAQAARLNDLRSASEGKQSDSYETLGAGRWDPFVFFSFDQVVELIPLDEPGDESEQSLQKIAQNQPSSASRPDEVGQLTCEVPPCQEQAQGNGNVGCVKGVTIQGGDDEGNSEEDSVACLVGGKAVVVREGDCVCCGLSVSLFGEGS